MFQRKKKSAKDEVDNSPNSARVSISEVEDGTARKLGDVNTRGNAVSLHGGGLLGIGSSLGMVMFYEGVKSVGPSLPGGGVIVWREGGGVFAVVMEERVYFYWERDGGLGYGHCTGVAGDEEGG